MPDKHLAEHPIKRSSATGAPKTSLEAADQWLAALEALPCESYIHAVGDESVRKTSTQNTIRLILLQVQLLHYCKLQLAAWKTNLKAAEERELAQAKVRAEAQARAEAKQKLKEENKAKQQAAIQRKAENKAKQQAANQMREEAAKAAKEARAQEIKDRAAARAKALEEQSQQSAADSQSSFSAPTAPPSMSKAARKRQRQMEHHHSGNRAVSEHLSIAAEQHSVQLDYGSEQTSPRAPVPPRLDAYSERRPPTGPAVNRAQHDAESTNRYGPPPHTQYRSDIYGPPSHRQQQQDPLRGRFRSDYEYGGSQPPSYYRPSPSYNDMYSAPKAGSSSGRW